jgi:hypothetical protein
MIKQTLDRATHVVMPHSLPARRALRRVVGPADLGMEHVYNYNRPHGAHYGKAPYEALREKLR